MANAAFCLWPVSVNVHCSLAYPHTHLPNTRQDQEHPLPAHKHTQPPKKKIEAKRNIWKEKALKQMTTSLHLQEREYPSGSPLITTTIIWTSKFNGNIIKKWWRTGIERKGDEERQRKEVGECGLLTQPLRFRCQQPICWRRGTPGARTPPLAPLSSGPAKTPSLGYMTPRLLFTCPPLLLPHYSVQNHWPSLSSSHSFSSSTSSSLSFLSLHFFFSQSAEVCAAGHVCVPQTEASSLRHEWPIVPRILWLEDPQTFVSEDPQMWLRVWGLACPPTSPKTAWGSPSFLHHSQQLLAASSLRKVCAGHKKWKRKHEPRKKL